MKVSFWTNLLYVGSRSFSVSFFVVIREKLGNIIEKNMISYGQKTCVPLHNFEKHPLTLCRLDGFLEYRRHTNFRNTVSWSECQVQHWKMSLAENCSFNTVFYFLSLSKGFVFSPVFLSIHLLNKRTEVLHYFIKIERHTANMLSIPSVFNQMS